MNKTLKKKYEIMDLNLFDGLQYIAILTLTEAQMLSSCSSQIGPLTLSN